MVTHAAPTDQHLAPFALHSWRKQLKPREGIKQISASHELVPIRRPIIIRIRIEPHVFKSPYIEGVRVGTPTIQRPRGSVQIVYRGTGR